MPPRTDIVHGLGLMIVEPVDAEQRERALQSRGPRASRFPETGVRALNDSVMGYLMGHALGIEHGRDIFEDRTFHA